VTAGPDGGVRRRRLDVAAVDAPTVHLLDATGSAVGQAGLRATARQLCDGSSTAYASRSYRYPLALVALHCRPVGADIERIERWTVEQARSILTPDERRIVSADATGSGIEPDAVDPSVIWSGKEALAKALGNALRYDPRHLGSPAFWPDGRAGPWRACRLPVPDGHVGWLCWRVVDEAYDEVGGGSASAATRSATST
jgi:hypothetical protein